jgi:hypothetical protein
MFTPGVLKLPATFVARMTNGPNVPAAVGVPESTPAAESVSPTGSVPEKSEYVGTGEPLATNVEV